MAKIRQLNEREGVTTALVEVKGIITHVQINRRFKTHSERNQEVIKKAKEQVSYEENN